jgi:monolysocardiolipin acyltransferase
MTESAREQAAVARWKPGRRWYHPLMSVLVVRLSKFIMNTLNTVVIDGAERFESLTERGGRGLLTFSNHVALFDDPLIVSNFSLPRYESIRWIAAEAINFFGSPLKAWLFTAGKAVPIVRGSGLEQPGLAFLEDRLSDGDWVHIFPEGDRTRDPQILLTHPFKSGIGRLMAQARPIVLPFYHYGMHEILPVGSKLPRRGKTARVMFGDPMDCNDDFVREVATHAGSADLEGLPLWEALAERAYVTLRRLEVMVHPAARAAQGQH